MAAKFFSFSSSSPSPVGTNAPHILAILGMVTTSVSSSGASATSVPFPETWGGSSKTGILNSCSSSETESPLTPGKPRKNAATRTVRAPIRPRLIKIKSLTYIHPSRHRPHGFMGALLSNHNTLYPKNRRLLARRLLVVNAGKRGIALALPLGHEELARGNGALASKIIESDGVLSGRLGWPEPVLSSNCVTLAAPFSPFLKWSSRSSLTSSPPL